ncbi:MAG: OB-fold domain-containing protein [Acidimicrobiales bacterium]|nr:OB-fold domain-containing protein [Acidimicrobiales bacterium]
MSVQLSELIPAERSGRLPSSAVPFWTSGADGRLRVGRCPKCARLLHPEHELCPTCGSEVDSVAVSGEATVVACTVNHQKWIPQLSEPYVVAVVALREDDTVRLATNIVGCEAVSVVVGLPVRVEFRRVADVWIPLFRPSDEPPVSGAVPEPIVSVPPTPRGARFEHRVVLSGIGRSRIGRRLGVPDLDLVTDACTSAISDAGLSAADIDGLCAYPGTIDGSLGARQVGRELSIEPTWYHGAHETPGQTGTVITAMMAVAAGLCRHVLCWSSVSTHRRPGLYSDDRDGRIHGEPQWYAPFGALSPAHWIALAASQYLARYRVSREALGWVAVAARRHAGLNPDALHRDQLDLDGYLAGRDICTPFGIHDCDVPCDGAYAVVVSSTDTKDDLRHPQVRVDAVGTRITERQSWISGTLTHQPNVFGPAAHLWSRASVGREDVDLATLYDGFTFNVLSWLEALGFCGPGEAGEFVTGADQITLGGALPINPHGGQLSAGRSNGYGQLHEAILQLRGQAGDRQVADAQVAVVSSGGGIPANCMLLTAHR